MNCAPAHFWFWLFLTLAGINAVGVTAYVRQVILAHRLAKFAKLMPHLEPVGSVIDDDGPELHFPQGVPPAGTLLFALKSESVTL